MKSLFWYFFIKIILIIFLIILFLLIPRIALMPASYLGGWRYKKAPKHSKVKKCKDTIDKDNLEEITLPIKEYKLGKECTAFINKRDVFPESKILEDNWKIIKKEVENLLKNKEDIPLFNELDKGQNKLVKYDNIPWRTFMIKAYGKWLDYNAKKVPETTKILKSMDSKISNALFSILDPHKHIPPHFGPTNLVYRYHLGLKVPQGKKAYIIVDNKKYYWLEGEGILFSDFMCHEVYNKSNETRVVLFLDIYRPDIPKWLIKQYKFGESLIRMHPRLTKIAKKGIK